MLLNVKLPPPMQEAYPQKVMVESYRDDLAGNLADLQILEDEFKI